jgi:serine/threonine protein kinase
MKDHSAEAVSIQLTRSQLLEVEQICDQYEAALRAGQPADTLNVEHYISLASPAIQQILRTELRQIRNEWIEADSTIGGQSHYLKGKGTVRLHNGTGAEISDHDLEKQLAADEFNASLFQRFNGRFEPLELLGAGASGVVWKVLDTRLNRIVAIKIPRAQSGENLARFVREARAASRLEHPGVVRMLELGEDASNCFLLMEFVQGESLAKRINESSIKVADAVPLLIEIADTLSYTHSQGIVHRDLKPQNILIDKSGKTRLVDFGLAKDWLDDQSAPTMTGTMLGTPAYIAPEQASAAVGKASPATDIYSAGIILYELLTGELPFRGSVERVLFQVHYVDPVRPSLIQHDVPEALETICLKCLEKNPADRFPTADELKKELVRFQEGVPIRSRRASVWKRTQKWARRNRRLAGMITLSALLLATTAIVSTTAAVVLKQTWQRERELRITAQDAEARLRQALQNEHAALAEATQANQQAQQQAEIAAQKAQLSHEALRFLQSTFQNTDPINAFFSSQSRTKRAPETAKSLLDSAVPRISGELAGQPTTQARLLDAMANAYRSMGEHQTAETLLAQAAIIRAEAADVESTSPDRLRDLATHSFYCGWLAHDRSDWDQAERFYRQALAEYPADIRRDDQLARAEILFQQGRLMIDRGQTASALAPLQQSLAIRTRWLPEESPLIKASKIGIMLANTESVDDLPLDQILSTLEGNDWASELAQKYAAGLIHRRQKEFDQAIILYQELMDQLSAVFPESHPLLILFRGDFVGLLYDTGNYRQAFPLAEDVLRQAEQICPTHKKLISFRLKLAGELSRATRFVEANELYETVLRQSQEASGTALEAHQGLIWCCCVLGKPQEAVSHAELLWNGSSQLTAWQTAWYAYAYARAFEANQQTAEAAEMDQLAYQEANKVAESPNSAIWLERLSVIHAHKGNYLVAEKLLREAVAIERTTRVPMHPRLADRLDSLASMLIKLENNDEALTLLDEVLAIRESQLPDDDHRTMTSRAKRASILQASPLCQYR